MIKKSVLIRFIDGDVRKTQLIKTVEKIYMIQFIKWCILRTHGWKKKVKSQFLQITSRYK